MRGMTLSLFNGAEQPLNGHQTKVSATFDVDPMVQVKPVDLLTPK
jgi:hypothetical protein